MAEVWGLIPAGGSGSRFSAKEDKLLALLDGVPVLVRSVQALLTAPSVRGVILVAGAQNAETYRALVQMHLPDAPVRFALGGATRRESVFNGLQALPASAAVVAIHDAARPLADSARIEQAVQTVLQGQTGAVLAAPVYDTVKEALPGTQAIRQTLDRSVLWRAQTPQVFSVPAILASHRAVSPHVPVTDDAQLMELSGQGPVVLIPSDDTNLKITVPLDFRIAEAMLRAEPQASLL